MIQALIKFSSVEDLQDYVASAHGFILEETDTTLYGFFSEPELELATNGYNAKIQNLPGN